jgi:cob(I)alamin adenosyltransferase
MGMSRLQPGLVQVYTGPGKGKTSAALGATWRALGAGLRVYFLQFLKGGIAPSEQALAERFSPDLVFRNLGHPASAELLRGEPTELDRRLAAEAWEIARGILTDPHWDLVVLDEVNNTLHLGLVPVEDLLAALHARPRGMEVICTGRHAPPALIEFADLVTEMAMVKHPYEQGQEARRGVDY